MSRLSFGHCVSLLCTMMAIAAAATIQRPVVDIIHRALLAVPTSNMESLQIKSLVSKKDMSPVQQISTSEFIKTVAAKQQTLSRLYNASRQQFSALDAFENKLSVHQVSIEGANYIECPTNGSARAKVLEMVTSCVPCVAGADNCPPSCCGMMLGSTGTQFLVCELGGW